MRCSDITENRIQTGFDLEFSNEINSATPLAQTGRVHIKEEGLNLLFSLRSICAATSGIFYC